MSTESRAGGEHDGWGAGALCGGAACRALGGTCVSHTVGCMLHEHVPYTCGCMLHEHAAQEVQAQAAPTHPRADCRRQGPQGGFTRGAASPHRLATPHNELQWPVCWVKHYHLLGLFGARRLPGHGGGAGACQAVGGVEAPGWISKEAKARQVRYVIARKQSIVATARHAPTQSKQRTLRDPKNPWDRGDNAFMSGESGSMSGSMVGGAYLNGLLGKYITKIKYITGSLPQCNGTYLHYQHTHTHTHTHTCFPVFCILLRRLSLSRCRGATHEHRRVGEVPATDGFNRGGLDGTQSTFDLCGLKGKKSIRCFIRYIFIRYHMVEEVWY